MNNSVVLVLAVCSFTAVTSGGEKGDKWSIKAKGKGLQNIMAQGGGYKQEYKQEYKPQEYKQKPQMAYYPMPMQQEYKKDEYQGHGTNHRIFLIPFFGGQGQFGDFSNGYGGFGGNGLGYFGGNGGEHDHYGGEYQ